MRVKHFSITSKGGKSVKEIQTITGLSAASISGYLPYQKTIYNLEESMVRINSIADTLLSRFYQEKIVENLFET